jgi:hypothetical protein
VRNAGRNRERGRNFARRHSAGSHIEITGYIRAIQSNLERRWIRVSSKEDLRIEYSIRRGKPVTER